VGRVNYLLDTNIILEYLLDQEKSGEVESFFISSQADQMFLSEFSLYSPVFIVFFLPDVKYVYEHDIIPDYK
jgi:predicted nucleic-acid-binding protein